MVTDHEGGPGTITSPGARPPLPDAITGPRAVAIARGLHPDGLVRIAEGLLAGGIRAFEVTLDSPGALDAIARLAGRFERSPLLIGAGTVLDIGSAEAARDAGARFLVSPHTDIELVRWAAARDVPIFPGAFSPTEILAAWRAGASAVKLFPASVLGPAFVRDVGGPFRHIPLIATGGVTLATAPGFIAAGAAAVGIGSWLIGRGDPTEIAARGAELVHALAASGP